MKSSDYMIPLPDIPQEMFPDVDVFIATHNESADLLYKTVNACTFMEYPDPEKVHIYICDDGNREAVRSLAERFGIGYLGWRKTDMQSLEIIITLFRTQALR